MIQALINIPFVFFILANSILAFLFITLICQYHYHLLEEAHYNVAVWFDQTKMPKMVIKIEFTLLSDCKMFPFYKGF